MAWARAIGWLFDGRQGPKDRLLPRWLFLRALGLIYFSAFFSLLFQIRGLIGPQGLLPAGPYLEQIAQAMGHWQRIWYAPTLLWWSSSSHMLMALTWIGLIASLLLVLNLWPRGMLVICFVCFLSFIAAAQDFSSYQSDGMLLEAGFISFFFAPPGFRPGLGRLHPPPRASLFLLVWEWFRIYFQSGAVKLLSSDPEWRNFTAMNDYYQNGPLPTWIGWYTQHLPHWFHAATTGATLVMELGLIWMLFMPRRWRIVLFFIVTPWQIGVVLTANYAFLNYLVLAMGVLLLDDDFLNRSTEVFRRITGSGSDHSKNVKGGAAVSEVECSSSNTTETWGRVPSTAPRSDAPQPEVELRSTGRVGAPVPTHFWHGRISSHWQVIRLSISALLLTWIFYATAAELMWMFAKVPLPTSPVVALESFRIANQYGLFAVMTRGRYEIEFQGSNDGQIWTPYPFRYKPQALNEPPRIYAPYQPRFDWNLWFASLGSWRDYPFVANTELRLLNNGHDVLTLFAANPFSQAPPREIRAVLWQYWFTSMAEKRVTGLWWRRSLLGLYAPELERAPDGSIQVVQMPDVVPRE